MQLSSQQVFILEEEQSYDIYFVIYTNSLNMKDLQPCYLPIGILSCQKFLSINLGVTFISISQIGTWFLQLLKT